MASERPGKPPRTVPQWGRFGDGAVPTRRVDSQNLLIRSANVISAGPRRLLREDWLCRSRDPSLNALNAIAAAHRSRSRELVYECAYAVVFQIHVLARAASEGVRLTLLNDEFDRRGSDGRSASHKRTSSEELLGGLAEHFDLHFPAATRFRSSD